MGKVADPLRKYVAELKTNDLIDSSLEDVYLKIADRIDADHESRMEQCRRETKRAAMHYLNSVIVDYCKHSMKRDRAAMVEKYEKKGRRIN